MPQPAYVKAATDQAIEKFAAHDGTQAILDTWGGKDSHGAAHKLGMLNAKLGAISSGLTDADYAELDRWIENLSRAEKFAALNSLVS